MAPNTSISIAAALICLLGMQSASAFSWQPCGEGKADISTVSLTPESPEPGVTVQFAIKGTANIGVAAGTLNISVAYQGLPIYSEVRDLCDMTTCPIQKGDLLIAYDQYLPPIVPPGEYTVVLVAGGTESEQLLCLQVDFDVTPPITRAKQSLRRAMSKLGVISRQHSEDGGETSRTVKAHT